MKIAQDLVLLGVYVASVSATVFTGTLNGQNIAYFNGDDMCSDNAPLHPNICDTVFSVDGIGGFQFHGCGTTDFVLLKDNSFNSVCRFIGGTIPCPQGSLTQTFACD